jgi:hypothetical protein
MDTQSLAEFPKKCEAIIIDFHEVRKLYSSLSKKMVRAVGKDGGIILPDGISIIKVPINLLSHLFSMKVSDVPQYGDRNNNNIPQCFGGFHHIDYQKLGSDARYNFYSWSLHNFDKFVADGYIVVNNEFSPAYKTFFVNMSSKEVLKRCLESLQQITSVEDNEGFPKRWKLKGQSLNGIKITSIVDKKTGNLITCYPTSKLSDDEVRIFTKQKRSLCNKRNFNPCYPSVGTLETDAQTLYNYFGGSVQVNLKFVNCDITSVVAVETMRIRNGWSCMPKNMVHSLLTNQFIDDLKFDFPSRQIDVLSSIEKFHLSLETIKFLFFSGQELFPKQLSSFEILDCLKESIANYLELLNDCIAESVWEDIDKTVGYHNQLSLFECASTYGSLTDGKTGTSWDHLKAPVYPVGPPLAKTNKHAVELMAINLCNLQMPETLTLAGGEEVHMFRIVPSFRVRKNISQAISSADTSSSNNTFVALQLVGSGTCYMDTWVANININPYDGNILRFSLKDL